MFRGGFSDCMGSNPVRHENLFSRLNININHSSCGVFSRIGALFRLFVAGTISGSRLANGNRGRVVAASGDRIECDYAIVFSLRMHETVDFSSRIGKW